MQIWHSGFGARTETQNSQRGRKSMIHQRLPSHPLFLKPFEMKMETSFEILCKAQSHILAHFRKARSLLNSSNKVFSKCQGVVKRGPCTCRAKRYVGTCMKGQHLYNSMVRALTQVCSEHRGTCMYQSIEVHAIGITRPQIPQIQQRHQNRLYISLNVVRAGTLG